MFNLELSNLAVMNIHTYRQFYQMPRHYTDGPADRQTEGQSST